MTKIILTGISMAVFLSAAGCGGDAESDSTGSGPPEPTPTGSVDDVPPPSPPIVPPPSPPISISGFVHAANGGALSDVQVCLQAGKLSAMDTGNCTTSGADGAWALQNVPANMQLTVGFDKDGFVPTLRAIASQVDDITLPPSENVLAQATDGSSFMGTPTDTTKGQIGFFVQGVGDEAPPEVSVTLIDMNFQAHGPVYLDADGEPKEDGYATAGTRGGFVNLSTRDYLLNFSSPSAVCTAGTSGLYGYAVYPYWDPESPNALIIVPVVEGHVTAPVSVFCTSVPPVGL